MKFASQREIFHWRPACLLRVSGADAETFLQGQFTNDLCILRASRTDIRAKSVGIYGLWLTLKGKVLADSFIVRAEDYFWVISYFSPAAAIRERLESYVIADDVIIEDHTADWRGLTVFGARNEADQTVPAGPFLSFDGRRADGGVLCGEAGPFTRRSI